MRVELKSGAVHLRPGQLLRLVDAQGSTVCALEGTVWITEENERRDVVLHEMAVAGIQHDVAAASKAGRRPGA